MSTYFCVYRYGKRCTERVTNTNYACFQQDIAKMRNYIREHKKEPYRFFIQHWAFGLAYIIHFYPEVN